MNTYKFDVGALWEKKDWKIVTNYKHEIASIVVFEDETRESVEKNEESDDFPFNYDPPCPHCSDYSEEECDIDDRLIIDRFWICPSVIIVRNEGGYSSTGLCLQCLLEASKTIEELK